MTWDTVWRRSTVSFLASGIADRFGRGDFTVIVGQSGVELAYDVLEQSGISRKRIKPNYPVDRSVEYWTGWALAYYQWETGLSFEEIHAYIPIRQVSALYHPFHEMDIRQFCDRMNELYRIAKPDTNLKLRRQKAKLTQKELADAIRSAHPEQSSNTNSARKTSIKHKSNTL